MLLLLADECSYRQINVDCGRDFRTGGLARVLQMELREALVAYWLMIVMRWLLSFTHQDFGCFCPRWTFELPALLMRERDGLGLSPKTCAEGCIGWSSCGAVRDPSSDLAVRSILRKSGKSSGGRYIWRTGSTAGPGSSKMSQSQFALRTWRTCESNSTATRSSMWPATTLASKTAAGFESFLGLHPGRFVLHSLPKYALQTNLVDRIWWHSKSPQSA